MKKVRILLLAMFAAMFAGCQNDELLEQGSGNDETTSTGDVRIIIEGEGMLQTQTRSADGRVDFTGGYATGAGLYNRSDKPAVVAHPDAGYEIDYFYGGPASEPKKYDYVQNQSTTFRVDLGGQDHTFHCGFKKKEIYLTVNAGDGGTTTPSGKKSYQAETAIPITATPKNGYEFTGWAVTEGDVTIDNPSSLSTTATLHNSNSTITANFVSSSFIIVGDNGYAITPSGAQQVGQCNWKHVAYGNGRYFVVGRSELDSESSFTAPYMTSSDGENWNLTSEWGKGYDPVGVAFGNNKFITSYSAGYMASTAFISSDWVWTANHPHYAFIPNAVAYGNRIFVIVGKQDGYGYSYTMDDSSTAWTKKVIGGITPVDITFNEYLQKFIALGAYGEVYTFSRYSGWSKSASISLANTFTRVASSEDGTIVAVGGNGYIVSSKDWNSPKQIGTKNWNDIIYLNNQFIVIGDNGLITKSADGTRWSDPEHLKDASGNIITVNLNALCAMQ